MAQNPTHILQALDALNELDNRLTDSIRAITRLSDQYATTAQSLTQLLIGTLPPDAASTMRTTITSFRSESTANRELAASYSTIRGATRTLHDATSTLI